MTECTPIAERSGKYKNILVQKTSRGIVFNPCMFLCIVFAVSVASREDWSWTPGWDWSQCTPSKVKSYQENAKKVTQLEYMVVGSSNYFLSVRK